LAHHLKIDPERQVARGAKARDTLGERDRQMISDVLFHLVQKVMDDPRLIVSDDLKITDELQQIVRDGQLRIMDEPLPIARDNLLKTMDDHQLIVKGAGIIPLKDLHRLNSLKASQTEDQYQDQLRLKAMISDLPQDLPLKPIQIAEAQRLMGLLETTTPNQDMMTEDIMVQCHHYVMILLLRQEV
jgi:hypothetical protein